MKTLVHVPGLWVGAWRGCTTQLIWGPPLLPSCFSPSLIKVRRVGARGGNAWVGHSPAPPLPRPRPALSPQGQEARKEPPGAMDGSVMEGPLFLQSQRFGTKVVGGRGTEPHQNLGVGDRAQ